LKGGLHHVFDSMILDLCYVRYLTKEKARDSADTRNMKSKTTKIRLSSKLLQEVEVERGLVMVVVPVVVVVEVKNTVLVGSSVLELLRYQHIFLHKNGLHTF
jgi:hypothetical protein